MPKYYPINEEAARRAKNANSFSDYVPGSATAAYREMVDRAYALGEQQKGRVDPMYHEKIDGLIDRYARKLAENINQSNLIDARVPSILIAGGSNFPVRKKEKQNAARDKNMGEYMQIEGLLDMGVFMYLQSLFSKKFVCKIMKDIRSKTFIGIERHTIEEYSKNHTADYLSAITNDVKMIEDNYLLPLLQVIQYTIIFIASLAVMIYFDIIVTILSFSEPIRASKNPSGREPLLRLPAFLCISWSMIASDSTIYSFVCKTFNSI